MKILSSAEMLKVRQVQLATFMKDAQNLIEQSFASALSYQEKIKIQNSIVSCYYNLQNYHMLTTKQELEQQIIDILNNPEGKESFVQQIKDFHLNFFRKGHRYIKELEYFVEKGTQIRNESDTNYPEILKKSTNIFVEMDDIPTSAFSILKDRIKRLNDGFPAGYLMTVEKDEKQTQPVLVYSNGKHKKTFRLCAFFDKMRQSLEDICTNFSSFDENDDVLMMALKSGNFATCQALKKEREASKEKKNLLFLRLLSSECLFYRLHGELKKHPERSFLGNIQRVCDLYVQASNEFTKNAQRGASVWDAKDDIRYMEISKSGYEIATLSTYKDWQCCLSMEEENDKRSNIEGLIGRGALVVYGLNQDLKKISRLLLVPYEKENGQKIYLSCCLKGQICTAFIDAVQRFARENLNSKENGVYHRVNDVYSEGLSDEFPKYDKGEDLLDVLGQEYVKDEKGKIFVSDSFSIARLGLAYLPDFSNVKIEKGFSVADNRHLTHLDNMPECRFLNISGTGISSFKGIREGVEAILCCDNQLQSLNYLPSSVHAISLKNSLVVGGVKVSKFKGCDHISLADVKGLTSIKGLPETCRYLDISGTKVKTLESLNPNMTFVNVHLCEDLKIIRDFPPEISLIICGLLDENLQKGILDRLARQPKEVQEEAKRRMMQLPKRWREKQKAVYENWEKARVLALQNGSEGR